MLTSSDLSPEEREALDGEPNGHVHPAPFSTLYATATTSDGLERMISAVNRAYARGLGIDLGAA